MKFALFAAIALALVSGPTYSRLAMLFDDNSTLISAFAPGTAPLFDDEASERPAPLRLAENR